MQLSIVTSLYQSAPFLEEFHARISACADEITDDYELILVNDGSPDGSLELALRLRQGDASLEIVDLSRNFGHHHALQAGIAHSRGDHVFLIDCDLDEAPELLTAFWSEMSASPDAVDIVFGVVERRRGGWFERTSGNILYGVIGHFADVDVPKNMLTVRLMTRRYVDSLLLFKERELVLGIVCVLTGFAQKAMPVAKSSRSSSSYTLGRRLELALNMMVAVSTRPLLYIFGLGLFITALSIVYHLYLVSDGLLFGGAVQAWHVVVASIWFAAGLVIMSAGVLGIYLSRVLAETRSRPATIVKHVYPRTTAGREELGSDDE